jgi:putative hydrolase of the HAD superfamily
MTIDTLLFDLDNTLIDTNQFLRNWAFVIDKEIYKVFYPEFSYQNLDDLQTRNRFFRTLAKETEKPNLQAQFQNYLLTHLTPNQDQLRYLMKLKSHFKMAIVSNGSVSNQQQKIHQAGLNSVFQISIISGQKGIRKPHADIFHLALKRLNSTPKTTLFVGDSLENDIEGANQLGMKSCWINKQLMPAECTTQPHFIIKNLRELEGVLSNAALY